MSAAVDAVTCPTTSPEAGLRTANGSPLALRSPRRRVTSEMAIGSLVIGRPLDVMGYSEGVGRVDPSFTPWLLLSTA